MRESIIWWHEQEEEHCPDGIDLIFVCRGEYWVIGRWDSDHDMYTDSNAQRFYDPIIWAYFPKIPTKFPQMIIATDQAADKLAQIRGQKDGKK